MISNAVYPMARIFGMVLALVPTQVWGQAYPAKQIRVIDAYPPGGSTDWMARVIAPRFAESTGQHWVVDNRPGGSDHKTIWLSSY